jgi:hypothetical protein
MYKFSVPCTFHGGQKSTVTFYLGKPKDGSHPIKHQSSWISDRGGTVPEEVMKALEKLKKIADEQNLDFEELCQYAFTSQTILEENSDADILERMEMKSPHAETAESLNEEEEKEEK